MTESHTRVVCKKPRLHDVRATTQRMIPKTRLTIIRNSHIWPNCVPVRTVNQSPLCKHSIKSSPVIVEATNQLQPNHDKSATRSVHSAVRQVSRWIVLSRYPIPAEGFLVAGRTIAASNQNKLASRIEADRCNQRTNIKATDIGVSRPAALVDYTVGIVTTQTNSNVKFPVVT